MKKIVILLAFLPVFGYGQTLNFRWKGGYTVSGSDTTLTDSITGGASSFIISYIDFDLSYLTDSAYIPINNNTAIELPNGDSMCVRNFGIFKRNYNYDSTTYFQIHEAVLNADSSLNRSMRIGNISGFTSAIDKDSEFNVIPYSGTWIDVPNDYVTIDAGLNASTPGDTVVIRTGDYNELVNEADEVAHLIAPGDVYWYNTNYCMFSLDGTGGSGYPFVFDGIEFSAATTHLRNGTTTPSYYEVRNCVFSGSGNVVSNTTNGSQLKIKYAKMPNRVTWYGPVDIEDSDMIYTAGGSSIKFNDTLNIIRSTAPGQATGIIDLLLSECFVNLKYSAFTDQLFVGSVTPNNNANIIIDSCDLIKSNSSPIITLTAYTDTIDMTVKNSTFYSVGLEDFMDIRTRGDYVIYNNTIDSSYQGIIDFAAGYDGHQVTINNNIFYSDSTFEISVKDYDLIMNNNSFTSALFNRVIAQGDNYTTSVSISNNQSVNKTNAGDYQFFIIGNFDSYPFKTYPVLFEKNNVQGCNSYGDTALSTHATVFYSCDSVTYRFNKIEDSFLGFVIKSSDRDADTTYPMNKCDIYGNLFANLKGSVALKGVAGASFINNECWNDYYFNSYQLKLITEDACVGCYARDIIIKNNIFSNTNNDEDFDIVQINSAGDTIGLDFTNNLYYSSQDSRFQFAGSPQTQVWWETNIDTSVYVNNPYLDSNGVPSAGSEAIDNGNYLGPPYNEALVVGSTWPDNLTTVTVPSGFTDIGPWDVESSRAVISNLKIIGSGNLLIRINK